MLRARILLILGIWVAILPYLGFPYSWKNILSVVSGLAIIYASFVLYREHKRAQLKDRIFDNFSENTEFEERA